MKLILLLAALVVMMQVIQVEALFGAALAFKAGLVGFALGRSFRGGRGFGGFGRGRGHGHGFGRGNRGRRFGRDLSAVSDEVTDQEQQEEEVDALQMDIFFSVIQQQDTDGCALKLVCELHTMEADQLGEEERIVLALFGSDVPTSQRADSPKRVYAAAAELGRRSGTSEACAEMFTGCPYNVTGMLKMAPDSVQ